MHRRGSQNVDGRDEPGHDELRKSTRPLSIVEHQFDLAAPRISEAGVADYLALLKPRVMSLVVFTALVGLMIAPGHFHPVHRRRDSAASGPIHRTGQAVVRHGRARPGHPRSCFCQRTAWMPGGKPAPDAHTSLLKLPAPQIIFWAATPALGLRPLV